jgi:hypothetical protein
MSKKVIKLTESQLKNIVERVISEQGEAMFDVGSKVQNPNENDVAQKRLNNIANIYSSVKNGVIVNPKSQFNNKSWMDFVTQFKVTDKEQLAAKGLIGQRKTTADTQNQRMVNIANVFHSVDPSTLKIKSTNPKLNGMSWSDYMSTYKITQDEVRKALAYANSLGKTAQPTPGATPAKPTTKPKSDPKVLALQKSLGFTGSDLDGIMGPKTRAAMAQKPATKRPLDTNIVTAERKPLTMPTVDASKLSQLPTIQGQNPNVSDQRKQEIASKIEKQPLTGKLVYKGEDLNPDEQQFLNTYVSSLGGGDLSKSKDKEYGQKMVYNNK